MELKRNIPFMEKVKFHLFIGLKLTRCYYEIEELMR